MFIKFRMIILDVIKSRLAYIEQQLLVNNATLDSQCKELPKERIVQRYPKYIEVDKMIKSGRYEDGAQIISYLEGYPSMACCENSSEFWWRYAIGKYFYAAHIYISGSNKSKEIPKSNENEGLDNMHNVFLNVRDARENIDKAFQLSANKSAELLSWYFESDFFK